MSTSVFDQVSRRVASRFLSTVVVVDDQALLAISRKSDSPKALKTPGRQGGSGDTEPVESTVSMIDSARSVGRKEVDR